MNYTGSQSQRGCRGGGAGNEQRAVCGCFTSIFNRILSHFTAEDKAIWGSKAGKHLAISRSISQTALLNELAGHAPYNAASETLGNELIRL